MNPEIKKILEKQDKSRGEYQMLIGFFNFELQNCPKENTIAIYDKLVKNYQLKFGKSIESLSIFRNKPQTLFDNKLF